MRALPTARSLLGLALAASVAAPLVATTPAAAAAPPPAQAATTQLAAAQQTRLAPTQAPPAGLGHDRIGVRRGDTWYLRDALDGGPNRSYREGGSDWLPVAGDTNGDGTQTVHLFRNGVWHLRDAQGAAPRVVGFGLPGDQPVLGDWNGDGTDTIGVYRAGRWYVRDVNANGPARVFGYGLPGDVAVVGDWNGDGRTGVGVRRGVTWYQRDSATAGPTARTFAFGLRGDVPVAGDWDHDGRDTPGLYRDGTWFFRQENGPSRYVTTRFGLRGDRPFVRRTPQLAPGVTHRVVREAGSVAQVVTLQLGGTARPDTVLAHDRLQGLDVTSTMTRRAGAVVGINGDYALSSGRPVHLFASDGRLMQTPQLLGRALGLDATGRTVTMGFPDVRVSLLPGGERGPAEVAVPRFNSGPPTSGELAGFSSAGALLETPPAEACYAGLRPAGNALVRTDGVVDTPLEVTGTRCGGPSPVVQPTGVFLAGQRHGSGEDRIRALVAGQQVRLSTLLGFPGAVDAIGGNPLLVAGGSVVTADVNGSGSFFDRHPRTAAGVTSDGRLLLVVVDGRQPGWSAGMTLRELADLMQRLGAREAINLDGGGSSTMTLNGLVVNRPSDGGERAVSSALVVLPGADRGKGHLSSLLRERADGAVELLPQPLPAVGGPARSTAGYLPAQSDPASTGGLADALQRKGVPLVGDLRRAAESVVAPPGG